MASVPKLVPVMRGKPPTLPPPDDDDDDAPTHSLQLALKPTSTDRKKQLDVAKAASTLKRIVKITIAANATAGDAKYMRKGVAVDVQFFSLWESRRQLHNYGCSVAVSLYLGFQLECAALFVLMLLLATPELVSNSSRWGIRHACRLATRNASEYGLATGTATTMPSDLERCGWSGIDISTSLFLDGTPAVPPRTTRSAPAPCIPLAPPQRVLSTMPDVSLDAAWWFAVGLHLLQGRWTKARGTCD